jgi:hypothetical protein
MIDRINKEIEPLTPQLMRQISHVIDFHGKDKGKAATRIAEILKLPLKVNQIYEILNDCK